MTDTNIISSLLRTFSVKSRLDDELEIDLDFEKCNSPVMEYTPRPILEIANKYANGTYENISTNRLYPVRILRWVDPVDIWISLESVYDRARDLHKHMQMWYNCCGEFVSELKNFSSGAPCAVKDGTVWRRGMINLYTEGSNTANVRFVDKGCHAFVDLCNLRALLNVFADVPPMAIHVKLFGVQMAELTRKLIKKANSHFRRFGNQVACRFVNVDDMYSLETFKIELYQIDQLDDYKNSYDLASMDVQFFPSPDEDLVAKSGLFKLSRGSWKNYEDFAIHRVHKKRVSFYEEPEFYEDDREWSDDQDGGCQMPTIRLIGAKSAQD